MRQFNPMLLSDAVCFTTDGLIRFKDIKPYYVLGAQCAKCKSLVRLDREKLEKASLAH